jgi:hypothetical protein
LKKGAIAQSAMGDLRGEAARARCPQIPLYPPSSKGEAVDILRPHLQFRPGGEMIDE